MLDKQNTRYSPKNFIKGKIVELIFDQMFREVDRFTILPFGYERTLPEVAQYAKEVKYQYILENIRSAPDFVLISKDKTEIFLVEVKYRTKPAKEELIAIAEKIKDKWNPIWIFLATPDGFYFDSCTRIINNGGEIAELDKSWVSKEIQNKYVELLKEFVK